KGELAAHCTGCKISYLNVPVAQWSTKIQSGVQTALLRDSSINFIVPLFDAMQQYAIPGIQAAGASSRVQTASYNGDPALIKRLQAGQGGRATIREGAGGLGYADIHEARRGSSGPPPTRSHPTPARLRGE